MAVFRKFLSATKNKMKTPNINIKVKGDGGTTSSCQDNFDDEQFERQKQDWQEELDQMSEFLVLKSVEEQKEEGVERPVDTAYVEDRDGMPVLRAVFDVHHFKPDDINLTIEKNILVLDARGREEKEAAVFNKTMLRRLELPEFVDSKMMHCSLSNDGILTIEMPFHLPPQKKPTGPGAVPIVDENGKRKIRMAFALGAEFTQEDIKVESNGRKLVIRAAYDAEIGKYGKLVQQRELKKEFNLPDSVEVETVQHTLSEDGKLLVEIVLKDEEPLKCEISTEEITTDEVS